MPSAPAATFRAVSAVELYGEGYDDTPVRVPDIGLAERLLDWMTAGLLDPGNRGAALRNVVLLILGTVAVKNLAAYVAGYAGQYVQEGVARDLRTTLYARLQEQGLGYFQRVRGGQLLGRMLADTDQAKWLVSGALVSVLQNAALIFVYLGILFSLSWRLALITLALVPAVMLVLRPILKRVRSRFAVALEERGEMSAVLAETVEGARLVKAHGAEAYERRRFGEATGRHFRGVLQAQRWAVLASPVSETMGAVVIVLLLLLAAGGPAGSGVVRPEVFMAFLVVSLRLLPPVKGLSQFPALAEQALAAGDRVFEVIELLPEDVDPPGAASFSGFEREIALRDVWVTYDGAAWALRGVDVEIRRGEVIALVGASGAGKSTLADLLPRFVEPTRGVVTFDGVPLTRFARRSLRRAMGIVSQHTVLFNDTVLRNIAYGDQATADFAAIEAAARAANAHGFIERLPHGYDTVLGERGMRLSGGERQRIAIARALLRDPPILILDEATSNLDPETERLVQAAILRLLQNRTVLVIAHRLTTAARADRVVVLDRGRVVEEGHHRELIAAGGAYRRLHLVEAS